MSKIIITPEYLFEVISAIYEQLNSEQIKELQKAFKIPMKAKKNT